MRNSFSQKTEYCQEHIDYFVTQKGINRDFALLLSSRGITPENVDKYFTFSYDNFYDPSLMKNMDEAVKLVKKVIDSKGSVLIYGDYDADGLSASCLLKLFFDSQKVRNTIIVPTREDGYGLNVKRVSECVSNCHYDLLVTVDCGISNREEIEQLKGMYDMDILVTDHHEVPEVIPDCVCINPKLGYPFAYLSGSGVAFKLTQAIVGLDECAQYADLASIGTIADMMPMLDENRDIVRLGLANFEHRGLIRLAEVAQCTKPYTAYDVAMRIAPRINAAGRVGDLSVAINVLCSQKSCAKEIAEQLNQINDVRKLAVDKLILEAEDKLTPVQAFADNLVYLYDDNWHKGILGIAANRFKEKYNLPAVIMTREQDTYVGSARGIDSLDLHDVFLRCSDLLIKFGGHRSSVGFTVSKNNVQQLQRKLSSTLQSYPSTVFDPVYYYDLPFSMDYLSLDMVELFDSMQPMFPNSKPCFYYSGYCTQTNLFGQGKNHLRLIMDNGLELKGFFRFADFYPALATNCECEVLFTLEQDNYSHAVIGIISQLRIKNSLRFDEIYAQNLIGKIDHKIKRKYVEPERVKTLLKQDRTLAIFGSYIEFEHYAKIYDFSEYYLDMFTQNSIYNKSVLISPYDSSASCNYKNVISFCNYQGVKVNSGEGALYYSAVMPLPTYATAHIDRDLCLTIFRALKKPHSTANLYSLYFALQLPDVTYTQFLVAIKVFSELGLIKLLMPNGGYTLSSQKTDLNNSATYKIFSK